MGAAFHSGQGALLLLPPLQYDEKRFVREDKKDGKSYWTAEATKFGKRLVSALVGVANNLKEGSETTVPPIWTMKSEYRTAAESNFEAEISKCEKQLASLQSRKSKLELDLAKAGGLRRLLYEQGKPLEKAVLEAMELFGFDCESFDDGNSEFDGIFVSAEGRCLGEVEGRDTKSIHIDKFSQLERNLQEDFAREEITAHAKGILFGNAFRLAPVSERGAFFTDKCVSAAQRISAALVRTSDLFGPAKYLKENPSDADYAKQCREVIISTCGDVVVFPPPPALVENSDPIVVEEVK